MESIKFKMRDVFNPDSDDEVYMLTLMCILNDLGLTLSSCLAYLDKNKEEKIEEIRKTSSARSNYYLRAACGHVFEGLEVFNALRKTVTYGRFIRQASDVAKRAHRFIMAIADDEDNETFKQLKLIRNSMTFHYGRDEIRKSLREYPDDWETSIVLGDTNIDSRYICADDVVANAMFRGIPDQELGPMIQNIRQLKEYIGIIASEFILWCFKESGYEIDKHGYLIKK